jgi:hypothetical protein
VYFVYLWLLPYPRFFLTHLDEGMYVGFVAVSIIILYTDPVFGLGSCDTGVHSREPKLDTPYN